jgi:hypothetical protein
MRMSWEGHVARMVGKHKERDYYEDVEVGGSIVLGWVLEK